MRTLKKRSTRVGMAAVIAMSSVLLAACGSSGSTVSATGNGADVTAAANDESVTDKDQTILGGPTLFKADQAAWDAALAGAKSEGKVVVHGPNIPPLVDAWKKAFKADTGLDLDYISLPQGQIQARISQELQAGGDATTDVIFGGNCYVDYATGIVDNVADKIIDPALFAKGIWPGDKMRPLFGDDKDLTNYCGVQSSLYVMPDLFVNPDIIDPKSITKWGDLMDPAYAGKIETFDLTLGGAAGTTWGYLGRLFGNDFVTSMVKQQKMVTSNDNKQLADWLVRGKYPIAIGLPHSFVMPFVAQGLKAERVIPEDGPGALTGGYGTVRLVKKAPHPNAATVFMNWFMGKTAQQIYTDNMAEPSLRSDVDNSKVPSYILPQSGVSYPVDDYSPTHYYTYRKPAQDALKAVAPK